MSQLGNPYIKGGLLDTPPDDRDFQLGNITVLPELKDLPESYVVDEFPYRDQRNSDFCSGFASVEASQPQEGVELCPLWSFAVSKYISGNPAEYGQDIRTACQVHQKYGALEIKDSPFSIENADFDLVRFLSNWPNSGELFKKSQIHLKKSFAKITGPYDHFDNIRASLWKYRGEKRIGVTGIRWVWPLSQSYLEKPGDGGYGHMIPLIGFSKAGGEDFIVVKNSYGVGTGDQGKFYLNRAVINDAIERYGAYMFIDLSKEQAEIMNKWPLAAKYPWLALVLSWFK